MGRLGRAISSYKGFEPQGFDIVCAYDASREMIGSVVDGLEVRDVRQMESDLRADPVDIGIVAVPGAEAQEVIRHPRARARALDLELRTDHGAGAAGHRAAADSTRCSRCRA